MMSNPSLNLAGYQFQELFQPEALQRLDKQFLADLATQNKVLYDDLMAYRYASRQFTELEVSELLIACAPFLEEFIAELFNIDNEVYAARLQTLSQDPIFVFKKWYVLREARRRLSKNESLPPFLQLDAELTDTLLAAGLDISDRELATATLGQRYLENMESNAAGIEQLVQWCIQALLDPVGEVAVKGWVSFHLPNKLDYLNLVPLEPVPDDPIGRYQGHSVSLRHRDGFQLTDTRMTPRQVLDEIHYCVYCHKNEGDYCSKGFPDKKNETRPFKENPLGELLTGCPLEEKISEMHTLKKAGYTIGALAMIMVDNPMCPVTGHRICNDCMKACIYQKQDPVDIPQTETGILTDVLKLPWGVEIYDLLTRWNPLRQTQWVAKSYNGLKVLVMGMGPAGFTLAHHLLMEGFAVVGTDGLKIEPLPEDYIKQPIYRYETIKESLESRIMAGFGGVAEYGITVRWDKNFLKLIYITLSRRPYFQVYGGVRFGGTVLVEDAWKLGFDHLAIAVGAGLPRELPIPGSLAPGMRQANDFLMALQLTGAAKHSSLANLQVRMPAVVIGGGLTGIDTATEVQAYYIAQVEKMLERYETLTQVIGEARVREQFDEYNFVILNEFLNHGKAVRYERERATKAGVQPDFNYLLRSWGGVTVAYRRLLRESPAYKRNHEEATKAFEEGIYYAEGLEPIAVRVDKYGYSESLVCRARIFNEQGEWVLTDEEHALPARSIFVATGARPNIAYEFEHRGTFQREGDEYRTFEDMHNELIPAISKSENPKIKEFGAFTSYAYENHHVTFLGDTHPVFHGSVVKAIASAKRTYPKIVDSLGERVKGTGNEQEYQQFHEKIRYLFSAEIVNLTRHSPSVIEMTVKAPMAAKNFRAGQFYRVQNYETHAALVNGTRLQTEAIALSGVKVDSTTGHIVLMVLEQGASSRLFATFRPGQPIAIMGPTGVRTKIPERETVMVIGGRYAIANLRTVGPALREAGNRVIYFAALKTADEVHCQEELEAATDKIVWITATGEPIRPNRPQDVAVTGELISSILRYDRGELENYHGGPDIPLSEINRVLVIGHHQLVRLMQEACATILKDELTKKPPVFASIYGPMQCMLKGVCAQCLQWQIDPVTGKRTKAVFTCSWQEQPLDMVDTHNLAERLSQNSTQEILTDMWLDYLFTHYSVQRI